MALVRVRSAAQLTLPADVRKAGSAFDLPIALGILAAQGIVERREIADVVILGELSLDGQVRHIALLRRPNGDRLIVVARNDDRLQLEQITPRQ